MQALALLLMSRVNFWITFEGVVVESIPFKLIGGNGPVLHFAHANGYPPGCYHRFLEQLTGSFRVVAIHHRPLWGPKPINGLWNWRVIADDLIRFLDENGFNKVIGVGHSLGGAATVIAAAKRPDLFRKLLLIEPVLLPEFIDLTRYLPWIIRKNIPVVKKALGRQDLWDSPERAFQYHRSKRAYRGLSDDALWDFINHATHKRPDGQTTLTYTKKWEAYIYSCANSIWKYLPDLKMPVFAIRGARSEYLPAKSWEKWKRLQPSVHFELIQKAGHLVPMETPEGLARLTLPFLLDGVENDTL